MVPNHQPVYFRFYKLFICCSCCFASDFLLVPPQLPSTSPHPGAVTSSSNPPREPPPAMARLSSWFAGWVQAKLLGDPLGRSCRVAAENVPVLLQETNEFSVMFQDFCVTYLWVLIISNLAGAFKLSSKPTLAMRNSRNPSATSDHYKHFRARFDFLRRFWS